VFGFGRHAVDPGENNTIAHAELTRNGAQNIRIKLVARKPAASAFSWTMPTKFMLAQNLQAPN
jgi:hypothetical protein